ncbi:A1A0 archaeal ATP synthase subunit E AhaE [methanogenic archaeon mixed culture ISO4-G1]|nr:A1A0 archaeal ATP synthase subunit E AhaE [methanogenic archaeon mixed culture ISO4-G1]
MALNNVTAEINSIADSKVQEIQAQTAQEIHRIQEETEKKIAGLKESEDKRLADTLARMDRQEASSAELESKKVVLAKKKEILSEVFDETLKELETASADVKLAQYKSMVAYAKTIIDSPKAIMSENDKFTAKQLGVKSVEQDSRIVAGLILQSEDGQIEIDMQYSALLRTVWDRGIKDVSDILFG